MKFECKKCGQCCKKFEVGLPLWEWEVEKLTEFAKEKNILLNLCPTGVVLDKKSGLAICAQYELRQEPCPFLIDNRCSIYESRPLVCRAFPLSETPALKTEGTISLSSFIRCKNFDPEKFMREDLGIGNQTTKLKTSEALKKYKETFGDILLYSMQSDAIKRFVDKTRDDLIFNNKIKLRKISKFDYNKYKIYPFFEFLVKIGQIDENTKNLIIKEFNNKEKLDKIIKEL